MPSICRSFMLLCLCALGALTVGCASGTKYSEMTLPPVPPGQARMIFYRDASPFGAAVQPEVKINQQAVGQSTPGGFFYADRAPGAYDVTCFTEWEHKLNVPLAPGETKFVHTYVFIGVLVGHVVPELMETNKAVAAIKDCRYTGTPLPGEATTK